MLAESQEAVENVRTCWVATVEARDSTLEVLGFSGDRAAVEMPSAVAFATRSFSTSASVACDDRRRTWSRYSESSSSGEGRAVGGQGAMSGVELVWPASEAMAGEGGREEVKSSSQGSASRGIVVLQRTSVSLARIRASPAGQAGEGHTTSCRLMRSSFETAVASIDLTSNGSMGAGERMNPRGRVTTSFDEQAKGQQQ